MEGKSAFIDLFVKQQQEAHEPIAGLRVSDQVHPFRKENHQENPLRSNSLRGLNIKEFLEGDRSDRHGYRGGSGREW